MTRVYLHEVELNESTGPDNGGIVANIRQLRDIAVAVGLKSQVQRYKDKISDKLYLSLVRSPALSENELLLWRTALPNRLVGNAIQHFQSGEIPEQVLRTWSHWSDIGVFQNFEIWLGDNEYVLVGHTDGKYHLIAQWSHGGKEVSDFTVVQHMAKKLALKSLRGESFTLAYGWAVGFVGLSVPASGAVGILEYIFEGFPHNGHIILLVLLMLACGVVTFAVAYPIILGMLKRKSQILKMVAVASTT